MKTTVTDRKPKNSAEFATIEEMAKFAKKHNLKEAFLNVKNGRYYAR